MSAGRSTARKPAEQFQLSLYAGHKYPPVVFNRPGLVTVGCNIHDSMLGYIYVTDSPFFGRTDAHGQLSLHDGAEYNLDWLGRQRGHNRELGLGAATFGWNETAGTLLAQRALYYDNRANSRAYEPALQEDAWHAWFDSAGARWNPASTWTFVTQWLEGHTCVAGAPSYIRAGNFEQGHAWTLAYERELNRSLSLVLEALQVDSTLEERLTIGEPPGAVERMLQLAVRWDLN